MDEFLKISKAISDRNRVRILKMLEVKPLCVCEITNILNVANSTVSNHLSILKESGLIIDKKDGKWVEYQINKGKSKELQNEVLGLVSKYLNDEDETINDVISCRKVNRLEISMLNNNIEKLQD
ncbi:hypothetical protein MASR1M45_29070 [Candidatus Kapaibacterium sp.]